MHVAEAEIDFYEERSSAPRKDKGPGAIGPVQLFMIPHNGMVSRQLHIVSCSGLCDSPDRFMSLREQTPMRGMWRRRRPCDSQGRFMSPRRQTPMRGMWQRRKGV